MKAKGIAAFILWAAMTGAAAESNLEEQSISLEGTALASDKTPAGMDFLRPLGVLLVLAGVGGGAFYLLRRVTARRPFLRSRHIKVLETAYISQKHALSLVRVQNKILVLGLGQEVQTLATFDKPEAVTAFDGEFQREFSDALKDGAGDDAQAAPDDPAQREVRNLRALVGRWRDRLTKGVAT